MGAVKLIASTPTYATGKAEVESAVNALTLSTTSDTFRVIPVIGRQDTYMVFSVDTSL